MQKVKICMVGDFAVGKTSLTQRYVNNAFSEKYLTTIGVKIDNVEVNGFKLIIWDVAGRDALSPINASYLSGAAGIVLVADGTRPETITSLKTLAQTVKEKIGSVPTVVAVNKCDDSAWRLTDEQEHELAAMGFKAFTTSARDGRQVPEMFEHLSDALTCQRSATNG